MRRGLFVVRYDSTPEHNNPPLIKIASETAGEYQLSIITDPSARHALLVQPGDSLVVKALNDGELRIDVTPQVPGGSTNATVKIERLVMTEQPANAQRRPEANARGPRRTQATTNGILRGFKSQDIWRDLAMSRSD